MSEWNFFDPSSRANLKSACLRESEAMLALAADPDRWLEPTGAGHWQVRDIIGHMVDTTETYFLGFDAARDRGEPPENMGLADMARLVDEGAQAFRGTPQDELLARLRAAREKMFGIVDELTDEEWSGMMVPHRYMGPLPAGFYPLFQLVDYDVHSWDVREGTGDAHSLDGDTADLLVPLAFILWQSTPNLAEGSHPYTVGVNVTSGHNAGARRVTMSSDGIAVEEGDVDDRAAVIEFDPATVVLTSYGRMNGGTVRGDRDLADQFLNSFFRI